MTAPLLAAGDPSPAIVDNLPGAAPFLLLGDHAGRAVPARLRGLGVPLEQMDRHIAWDIGIEGLGRRLAARLDACFIHQSYSRLVIDCNRSLSDPGCLAAVSDGVAIPGNQDISADEAAAREAEIYRPYHDAIAAELDGRAARGQPTMLVSLHSFTPSMGGQARPWRFGVLHRDDSAFSQAVLGALRMRWGQKVGDNQPYRMDGTDYTIPFHADRRGLDYLELEVRQDLLATPADQDAVAGALGEVLGEALAHCRTKYSS